MFAKFTQAAAQAAKAAGQAASSAVSEVQALVSVKSLRNYVVGDQITTAGPQNLWKIYRAKSKLEGAPFRLVSVWVLEKRYIHGDAAAKESFLELARKDAAHLTRLKHPCVLRLVEPFEETRTQLVLVTECIIATATDFIKAAKIGASNSALADDVIPLSELEIKHGMLQIAEGLNFLHSEASIVHCGLCPSAMFLTPGGIWKIGCFSYARALEFSANADDNLTRFDYQAMNLALYPDIQYTAPELVCQPGTTAHATPAADIFSLGAVMYEFFMRQSMIPCRANDVMGYRGRISSLGLLDMGSMSMQLQSLLRTMITPSPHNRPSALGFVGSQYFQDDQQLRALRFLDGMIQRDNLQKAAFLKELQGFWEQFDQRVLRYKVLPPLLQELRNEALQTLVLPLVIKIVQQQSKQDFMDFTMPALKPICDQAKGETLLLLVKHAQLLVDNMPAEAVGKVVVPMLIRAAEGGDARAQEEMLKAMPLIHQQVDYQSLKTVLLPKAHQLCLRTTSAAVRVSSLVAIGKVIGRMDKEEAVKVLDTASKVTAVDKSAPTVMSVVGIVEQVAKQWGSECTATQCLPVITPLLIVPSLSHQQFSVLIRAVREMIKRIEDKRGGELQESEVLAAQTAGAMPSSAISSNAYTAKTSQAGGATTSSAMANTYGTGASKAQGGGSTLGQQHSVGVADGNNPFTPMSAVQPTSAGNAMGPSRGRTGLQDPVSMHQANRSAAAPTFGSSGTYNAASTGVRPGMAMAMGDSSRGSTDTRSLHDASLNSLSIPWQSNTASAPTASLQSAMGSLNIGSNRPFAASRPSVPAADPFGGSLSLLAPSNAATVSQVPAAGASAAPLAGGLGEDDLFRDPGWKDPVLPVASTAATQPQFAAYTSAVPAANNQMKSSALDPFADIFGSGAQSSANTTAGSLI